MPSVPMNTLVGAALLFLAGLLACLFALGWIGNKPGIDPVPDPRLARVRRSFRVVGPALLVFAVLLLCVPPAPPPPPPEWRTVLTSDGVCSVEMPGAPSEPENPGILEELAKPATQQWLLVGESGRVQYYLSHSDIEGKYAEMPPEKLLEVIAGNWFRDTNTEGNYQRVSERKLSEKGWPGRELVIDRGEQRLQNRWLVVNKRLYRTFVLTPTDEAHLSDAARFLDSFHVRNQSDLDKGP
jgi:hypothetical protein